MTQEEISRIKYMVCCPTCDNEKCVRNTDKCEAEQWAKRNAEKIEEKQTIEDYKRKLWMHKLSEMPYEVIATAYLYAVNYIAYGEDVTKEWPTVVRQTQALETAYRKGYYDAMKERNKE